MSIKRVGPWFLAARIIRAHATKFNIAVRMALAKEAHRYRKEMVQGIRDQAPGGKKFAPISRITRFLKGSSKALIDTGDLRNSYKVTRISPWGYFVGVHRTARGRTSGQNMVNVAIIQEFGTKRHERVVTPKMEKLFWVLFKEGLWSMQQSNKSWRPPKAGERIFHHIRARPVVAPVWEKMRKGTPARIAKDIALRLGLLSRL